MEPTGSELIERYKKNYHIPSDVEISEEAILKHWELEKKLTAELLHSTPENRWQTFERCYTELYSEIAWLNQFSDKLKQRLPSEKYNKWINAIGLPPKLIYEIGSGTGDLISFLAETGYTCKGTEITSERGEKYAVDPNSKIDWGVSDGVHFERFEPSDNYDVVISDQVIEHLHPEDVIAHFEGVHHILKREGRYLICTPHWLTGPHDISRVFKMDRPKGMHLKEYSYQELVDICKKVGYQDISFTFIPKVLQKVIFRFGRYSPALSDFVGKLYLKLLLVVEKILGTISNSTLRRSIAKSLRKVYLFSENISISAIK